MTQIREIIRLFLHQFSAVSVPFKAVGAAKVRPKKSRPELGRLI